MAKFDKYGREIPDPTPVELPVGFRHPPSLAEEIRRLVEVNLKQAANAEGFEDIEEASDFDIPDEEEMVVSGLQVKAMEEDVIMAADAQEAFRLSNERSSHGRKGQSDGARSEDNGRSVRRDDSASGKTGGPGDASGDSGRSENGSERVERSKE